MHPRWGLSPRIARISRITKCGLGKGHEWNRHCRFPRITQMRRGIFTTDCTDYTDASPVGAFTTNRTNITNNKMRTGEGHEWNRHCRFPRITQMRLGIFTTDCTDYTDASRVGVFTTNYTNLTNNKMRTGEGHEWNRHCRFPRITQMRRGIFTTDCTDYTDASPVGVFTTNRTNITNNEMRLGIFTTDSTDYTDASRVGVFTTNRTNLTNDEARMGKGHEWNRHCRFPRITQMRLGIFTTDCTDTTDASAVGLSPRIARISRITKRGRGVPPRIALITQMQFQS